MRAFEITQMRESHAQCYHFPNEIQKFNDSLLPKLSTLQDTNVFFSSTYLRYNLLARSTACRKQELTLPNFLLDRLIPDWIAIVRQTVL